MTPVRIVFMGSPAFASPILQRLAQEYTVCGVVTQPDRPAGRGKALTPPIIKILAQELGIPFIQPARLRDPQAMEQLQAWAPELIVVAAFGQILRQNVLDLPRYGCINVHASLLPRWRGAAPIQAAILHGDEVSGVTIMKMDAGIDTGGILSARSTPIQAADTAETLSERLARLGAELLVETLPAYLEGSLLPQPQDESLATYAPMLKKEDGELDFSRPAPELERRIRAFTPWPGAFFRVKETVIKVRKAAAVQFQDLRIGKRTIYEGKPLVVTAQGGLVLEELQPAGKKWMSGVEFLRGARYWTSL